MPRCGGPASAAPPKRCSSTAPALTRISSRSCWHCAKRAARSGQARKCEPDFGDSEPATEEDWTAEYLAPIIAVTLVDGVGGAIEHIERYGSHHTEAIVAEDKQAVERFFAEIDSAILLHNASTQFADGGEFGMGAEIGIATGSMHARGPVGVEQLTSFKYRVRGSGQMRP